MNNSKVVYVRSLWNNGDWQCRQNTYLISINVTNKQKERYYNEYVPDLLDVRKSPITSLRYDLTRNPQSLQDLSESSTLKLNTIWSSAAAIEVNMLGKSREHVEHLGQEIPRNKPVLDSMMFVRHNASNWQEPHNFAFEPSPLWHDDEQMITNSAAKVFLQNILGPVSYTHLTLPTIYSV